MVRYVTLYMGWHIGHQTNLFLTYLLHFHVFYNIEVLHTRIGRGWMMIFDMFGCLAAVPNSGVASSFQLKYRLLAPMNSTNMRPRRPHRVGLVQPLHNIIYLALCAWCRCWGILSCKQHWILSPINSYRYFSVIGVVRRWWCWHFVVCIHCLSKLGMPHCSELEQVLDCTTAPWQHEQNQCVCHLDLI